MADANNDAGAAWHMRGQLPVVLALLAVLTTGLTVFERRLFQDDVQVFVRVFTSEAGTFERFVQPITSPTRRLQGAPYALGLASGEPLLVIRLTSELLTFGIGLLAAALARDALRLPRAAVFAAGALTITASSDWLTASFVAVGYNLAIFLHLAGVLAFIRWSRDGRIAWLIAATTLGVASLWTIDVAAVLHLLAPVFVYAVMTDRVERRRTLVGGVVWLLAAAPYYALLAAFLRDDRSYAGVAITGLAGAAWIRRAVALVVLNVSPWEWAFDRRAWFPPAEQILPIGLRMSLSGAGAMAAGWVLWRLGNSREAAARARRWGQVALLALMTIVANLPYAAVQLSEFRYRTQLMSRVWASLALATLFALLVRSGRGWVRAVAAGGLVAFVALGILGGLERQDYFLAFSRRHDRELRSIQTALPSIDREARVLLRLPPHPLYAATDAPYLARAWVTLLGADPTLGCRTFVEAESRGATCTPGPDALVCSRGDRSRICDGVNPASEPSIPYDRLIVLSYDHGSQMYALEQQLPQALTPSGSHAAIAARSYAPERLVKRVEPSWIARSLLELSSRH